MEVSEREDSVDMCLAIQKIKEESKLQGKIEGAITFAKELGILREEMKKNFMIQFGKSEAETEKLSHNYWR
jgi:hypothetical protein